MRGLSAQAFIALSGRGSNYHLCVVVIANGEVNALRRVARSSFPGQRRWHFVRERDGRRRQVIDTLVTSNQVTALNYDGKGGDTEIRAEASAEWFNHLLDRPLKTGACGYPDRCHAAFIAAPDSAGSFPLLTAFPLSLNPGVVPQVCP